MNPLDLILKFCLWFITVEDHTPKDRNFHFGRTELANMIQFVGIILAISLPFFAIGLTIGKFLWPQ